jgi:hypothetical protein
VLPKVLPPPPPHTHKNTLKIGFKILIKEINLLRGPYMRYFLFHATIIESLELSAQLNVLNECNRDGPSWPLHRDHSDLLCLIGTVTSTAVTLYPSSHYMCVFRVGEEIWHYLNYSSWL